MVQLNHVLWWPLNQRCLGNCNIESSIFGSLSAHWDMDFAIFTTLATSSSLWSQDSPLSSMAMAQGCLAFPWLQLRQSQTKTQNPGHLLSSPVDGKNPANQLRLVVYPIIYNVLAPSQVVGDGIFEPSTVYSQGDKLFTSWRFGVSWLNCSKSQQMLHIQMVPRHRV